MSLRTVPNDRLIDGAKLDNLPSDVNAELALKASTSDLNAHTSNTSNPHGVTKSQIGLGNVDNTSDLDKPLSTAALNALAIKQSVTQKGVPNGYAPLDGTGKVPLANLPAGGSGDVSGPASSTDNALARFDATTGKLIQNGVITESDNGDFSNVNAVSLDVTPTSVPTSVGTLSWNPDEDTLDIRQGSSILQVGQEQQWNVRNNTASTITEGTPVYVTGTTGASGRLTVSPFVANGSIPSMYYLGIMTQDVLPGADGKATTFGKIRQINTSMWNDGDVLYCSPTVAGQLTNVQPSTPNYIIPTAFVIHSATNGTIAVRVPTLHEAKEVNYSNAVSLLTASNIQDAIDELNFEKVNKTTTVNGHSLATDVTLTASDVGAPSGSGTSTGTNTGDQDLSGLVPKTRTLTINGTSYDLSADRSWTISAGGGGGPSSILSYSQGGTVVSGTVNGFVMRRAGTLNTFGIDVSVLPTGSDLTVDLKKNGTSVLSAPLSITTTESATNGVYSVKTGDAGKATIATSAYSAGDVYSLVIVAGSTSPGYNLNVEAIGTNS